MKLHWVAFVAATIGLAALAPLAPAAADEFTPAQKQELGPIIRDYLVGHPEVLREAIEALDKHDKEAAQAEREKAVSDRAGPLFSSPFQANVGNPDGNATLVEFFDYNCHFCKGALPDIANTLNFTRRSMPAMPMADNKAPMVVGISVTNKATSTTTEILPLA